MGRTIQSHKHQTHLTFLVGELGVKTRQDKDEEWFAKFIDYIKEEKLHCTFQELNPNSGATIGILNSRSLVNGFLIYQ